VYKVAEFTRHIQHSNKHLLKNHLEPYKKRTNTEITGNEKYITHHDIDFRLIGDEFVYNISFLLHCRLMSMLFESKTVPVFLLSYGRQFGKNYYFHTVGEFLDLVPLLIEYDESNPYNAARIMDQVGYKLKYARDHSFNMLNSLLSDPGTDKDWLDLHDTFKPVVEDRNYSINVFNFIEKFGTKDFHNFVENYELFSRIQTNTPTFDCSVLYTDEILRLIITSPFHIDEEIFKKAFDVEFIQQLTPQLLAELPV